MDTLSIPMTAAELPIVAAALETGLGGPDARLRGETDAVFVTRVLREYAIRTARLHLADLKAATGYAEVMKRATLAEAAAAAVAR